MSFQAPMTIREALQSIETNRYLLPAIQREVVWSKDQIARLFDSLMQGYPIGSFLFWNVREQNSKEYTFYEFMTHYHGSNNRHLKRHDLLTKRDLIGVLDGQQRLTALNIGLRGSYSERIPRSWANIASNYPETFLYLRLDQPAGQSELGLRYDFRFLTEGSIQSRLQAGEHWFRVKDVIEMQPVMGPFNYVNEKGLIGTGLVFPMETLTRLHQLVNDDRVINYFLEPSQDLDKVLNIFIRVNSGGTILSHSDLLLSIATSQWKGLDAREAVYGLADELNSIGEGFEFDKDLILKSGLMLNDIPSVQFQVRNFNAENMAKLESNWEETSEALRRTVRLLSDFGFNARTLTARSVVLPIAYYLYKMHYPESYFTHPTHASDRLAIRSWVTRSIIKSGVWNGADQLLVEIRRVLAKPGMTAFPGAEIEQVMAMRGRAISFTEGEIQELAVMPISDKRCFAFLSLLYPGMDFKNAFHIDHVFPVNSFSRLNLLAEGFSEEAIPLVLDSVNRLPNLQLLQGPINASKQDKLPLEWIEGHFVDLGEGARADYFYRQLLGTVPPTIAGFKEFYDSRHDKIVNRVMSIFGSSPGSNGMPEEGYDKAAM